jgi:hypothetical protein
VTSPTERLRVIASTPISERRARHLVDEAAMTAALADGRIRLAALETVGVLLSTSARSTAS